MRPPAWLNESIVNCVGYEQRGQIVSQNVWSSQQKRKLYYDFQ